MKARFPHFLVSVILAAILGCHPAAGQQPPQQASPQQKAAPSRTAGPPAEAPKPPAASPQKPEAKPEEEEYEIIEQPTAFGIMRYRVPKQKGASGTAPAALPGEQKAATAPAAPGSTPEQKPATPQQPAAGAAPAGAGPPAAPPAQAPVQAPAAPPPAAPAEPPAAAGSARVSLHLENANMLQVIGIIAAELKMNYIVDPNVRGAVNINTLGDLRQEDLLPLLQAVLRANGATAVQSGSFWRIVQSKDAPRIPIAISQEADAAKLPADDRVIMNIVPLRFVTAADMSKILSVYLSEIGQIVTHEPGNILMITDTSRSMKRLMELINVFDTDTLAKQRIRVFPVENARAADLVKDLAQIFSAYALSEKSTAVRFIPIERLNSILVVSGNPNVYPEVQQWLGKLDQSVRKVGIQNFVYKVENGTAENLASLLSSLYGGGRLATRVGGAGAGLGAMAGAPGATFGGAGGGGSPGGGISLGGAAATAGGAGAAPAGMATMPGAEVSGGEISVAASGGSLQGPVRIVPDLVNNALLIQATPQDYETIRETLKQLDIIPRQVLIEAKVYEVDLSGALAFGVEAFLQQRSDTNRRLVGQFSQSGGGFPNPGLSLSAGTLVGRARELLFFLNAQENRGRTRVLSAPTVLASDNMTAHIQVGAEVPILTSQGVVAGAQAAGSSLFTNTIQQRDTGVILSVTPRINPSGMVTMQIQQEVSSPQPPTGGGINSPSILKRSVNTQATVKDGETIALGGIISENRIYSKSRVPLLGDIPGLGLLFGSTSYSVSRTELIVLLTPRVMQTVDEIQQATEEFKSGLKGLRKMLRDKTE
jgi:general secretion pathway protein D